MLLQALETLDENLALADSGPDGDYLDQLGRLIEKYRVQLPKIRVSLCGTCSLIGLTSLGAV